MGRAMSDFVNDPLTTRIRVEFAIQFVRDMLFNQRSARFREAVTRVARASNKWPHELPLGTKMHRAICSGFVAEFCGMAD